MLTTNLMIHADHPPISPRGIALILAILMAIGVMVSYPLIAVPMIADPDAYGKSLEAWFAVSSGDFFQRQFSDQWLPFATYFHRASILLWSDLYTSPRYLTMAISLISIPLFYLYSRGALSQKQSLIATTIYTMLPIRIVLSTQPLTEPLIPLFLLPLFIGLSRPSSAWLVAGLTGFCIALGIRYEVWFFLPVVWILSRYKRRTLRFMIFFISLIVPVWWTLLRLIETGKLIPFLTERAGVTPPSMHALTENIFVAAGASLSAFFEILPVPVFLLACAGGFTMLQQGNKKIALFRSIIFLLPWYTLLCLIILIYSGIMEWIAPRFFFLTAIFCIPAVVVGADLLYKKSKFAAACLAVFIGVALPSYIARQHESLTYRALLGNAPKEKIVAANEVIRFINDHPQYTYEYRVTSDNYDFVTMISYFTKSDMYMRTNRDSENTPRQLRIVEQEEGSEIRHPGAVLENKYFAIYAPTALSLFLSPYTW
jgi:hypothetical protein